MRILLVRHGETPPNREGLLLGRGNPSLTATGERQAAAVADALAAAGVERVVSSPLGRAQTTARVIAERVALDVETDERLIEIDYGEWEGMPLADIPSEVSLRWRRDPAFAPPGGESLSDLQARVGAWCAQQRDRGVVTVAVTHVSPVKAGVAWALGGGPELAWKMYVGVASITTIGFRDHEAVLMGFNERGHLSSIDGDST